MACCAYIHTYIHISWQTHIDRIGGSLCRHIHIYKCMDMDLGARTSCHDIAGSSWMDGGHREEHTYIGKCGGQDAWKKEILGFNLVNVRPPRNRARDDVDYRGYIYIVVPSLE